MTKDFWWSKKPFRVPPATTIFKSVLHGEERPARWSSPQTKLWLDLLHCSTPRRDVEQKMLRMLETCLQSRASRFQHKNGHAFETSRYLNDGSCITPSQLYGAGSLVVNTRWEGGEKRSGDESAVANHAFAIFLLVIQRLFWNKGELLKSLPWYFQIDQLQILQC